MINILDKVKEVISLEIATLKDLREVIDDSFIQAIELIRNNSDRKLIVSGMGKSGHAAKKMVATFSSTGTPAIFLHPSEALHGDLGIVERGDVVIIIGKSGESDEIIGMIPSMKTIGCKIIAITANRESTLAKHSDIILYTPVEKEACTLNLAPTCSVISALAVGDALAVTLMSMNKFTQKDFALFHPAGRIGKRLLYMVNDIMRKDEQNPVIKESEKFSEILTALAKGGANALSVIDQNGVFTGLITSYDIRKVLTDTDNLLKLTAGEIKTINPVTIDSKTYAFDAYSLMKNSPKPLNVLPVLDSDSKPIGMLTLQDMVRAGL